MTMLDPNNKACFSLLTEAVSFLVLLLICVNPCNAWFWWADFNNNYNYETSKTYFPTQNGRVECYHYRYFVQTSWIGTCRYQKCYGNNVYEYEGLNFRCNQINSRWVCTLNTPNVFNLRCQDYAGRSWQCIYTSRRLCTGQETYLSSWYGYKYSSLDCCDSKKTALIPQDTCCWSRNQDRCFCSQGTFCAGIVTPKPVVTAPPKPTPKPKEPTTIAPKTTSTLPPTTTTTTTTKPTTTTTETTTTTTTTTETTTILPAKKVCAQFRLLNGEDANACDYPGATRIENQVTADKKSTTSCNAVFVNIMVAGKQTPAFYTSNLCHKAIQAFTAFKKKVKSPAVLNFKIDSVKVPLDVDLMFDTKEASSGSSWFYVVKEPFRSMLNYTDRCRSAACTIAKNTYEEINLSDCELVSFGYVDKKFTQRGLQRTKVKITPNSLCRTEEVKANHPAIDDEKETMCFRQVDKKNLFCNGDAGSALYCMSQAKEKVLVGVAAHQKYCDQSSFVRIIPYPVDEPSRENKEFVAA